MAPFRKILIANRGEIAVRVMRSCRELGIATVAVYSEADRDSLHVRMADEAVEIGPAPAGESYLRRDRILDAARRTGAQAIHPGYGFLSENPDFADAVRDAGLVFIGPTGDAMRAMGHKTSARAAMAKAGVPIVPGYQESQRDDDLVAAAERIGFPVLVKATAGGGGKGMRVVPAAAEIREAIGGARREAAHAFGDDRIYLEKYFRGARHIEFQVLADRHGHVVHLFERECSVQRRHQKIVEETPSPAVDDELRARMGEAAVAAARAVRYENAGTIEFLLGDERDFYFLEMNTRLQVEHPITELVTGRDLVLSQLRIAAGEPLPFDQAQLSQRGHAIECRVYAEDPGNGFLPDTGALFTVVEPRGPGVRVDSGVASGDTITHHYDPMIAKLVVQAEDRASALRRMERALSDYVILGVTTNLAFLRDVLAHEVFRRGGATTRFIDEHMSEWRPCDEPPPDEVLIAAALADALGASGAKLGGSGDAAGSGADPWAPWRRSDGFRLSGGGGRS
ncbi:MAG: acetyl-CoA carboxylase biotin carboxylase subunit [bacterium]